MSRDETEAAAREFQKGLDAEQARRSRQDDRLSLRRKDRKEHIKKKRKKLTGGTAVAEAIIEDGDSRLVSAGSVAVDSHGSDSQVPEYVRLENLDRFVSQILNEGSSIDELLQGVQAVRQLLSVEEHPPIGEIVRTGIVPRMLDLMRVPLRFDDPKKRTEKDTKKLKLQFEAAWAATNIASGESKFARELVDQGGVQAFTDLIKNSRDPAAIDQAIWGLGNIAGDCVPFRDKVLNTGVLSFILKNLKNFPPSVRRNAVWCVSNLCRGKPSPNWDIISHALLPLVELLDQTPDYEIICDMLWSLSFISEDRAEPKDGPLPGPLRMIQESGQQITEADMSFQLEAVLKTGVVPKVIRLVEHASNMQHKALAEMTERHAKSQPIPDAVRVQLNTADFLLGPCTRILGNLVSGTDAQTQAVIDAGFFKIVRMLLNSRVRNVRKEACWALSNVVAGTRDQMDKFFADHGLVEAVLGLCSKGDINVRKEAGWCLSNAICGASFTQIQWLIRRDFLKVMIGLLSMMHIPKVLLMTMEAIDGCLAAFNKEHGHDENAFNPWVQRCEELEILDRLEDIQTNQKVPDNVADAAANLVMKYWPPDEEFGGTHQMSDAAITGEGGDSYGFGGADPSAEAGAASAPDYGF